MMHQSLKKYAIFMCPHELFSQARSHMKTCTVSMLRIGSAIIRNYN